jgi:hypothetical protein
MRTCHFNRIINVIQSLRNCHHCHHLRQLTQCPSLSMSFNRPAINIIGIICTSSLNVHHCQCLSIAPQLPSFTSFAPAHSMSIIVNVFQSPCNWHHWHQLRQLTQCLSIAPQLPSLASFAPAHSMSIIANVFQSPGNWHHWHQLRQLSECPSSPMSFNRPAIVIIGIICASSLNVHHRQCLSIAPQLASLASFAPAQSMSIIVNVFQSPRNWHHCHHLRQLTQCPPSSMSFNRPAIVIIGIIWTSSLNVHQCQWLSIAP